MVAAAALTLAIVAAVVLVARARRPFLARFRSEAEGLVSPERIGETLGFLARKPHRAGTAANAEVADEIARRLTTAGLKIWSDVHDVELWEPVALSLALTKPAPRAFDLNERARAEDAAPAVAKDEPFLAYAADGDLEASLVYAGSGAPADFDILRKAGVDVRGKIALVRLRGACLGMKAVAAERAGVSGLLVYEEPRDEGLVKPASPEEPAASRFAAPRGSLLKSFLRPGDPRGAKAAGVETLPTLPALAISRDAAESLLKELRGPAPPAGWKGLLDAAYDLGPGPARVRMVVRGKLVRASLRNVFATIPGADPTASPVVIGSHFDAWGDGAVALSSGAAAVLEAATVLAHLAERGWKPSRPVIFAFFDGEEYGMLGSTPWLRARLVAGGVPALTFVNVDETARAGDFAAATTPGLRESLGAVLSLVRDPASSKAAGGVAPPGLPGFSSDAAAFLGFSATPVVELGFGPRPGAPALARSLVLLTGTLATPRFFPFRFEELADFANRELREIARRHPASSGWLPQSIRTLSTQVDVYAAAAKEWDLRAHASGAPGKEAGRLDRHVSVALGAFGVPGDAFGKGCRLWGPSLETGCGAIGLPGLEQAVARGDRAAAAREAELLAEAFVRARSELATANLITSGARRPSHPPDSGAHKQ